MNLFIFGFLDLPGPPRDLRVSDVTRGTCRLTWKPPQCDGGERVKSYFIEKKTVNGKAWTKVRTSSNISVLITHLEQFNIALKSLASFF